MWILKNSKELFESLKAQSLYSVNSIKSFDFSTLYTTIPHDKLKSKSKEIINQCFFLKNGNRRLATLKTFYGRHHDLLNPYNVAVSRIVSDVFASDAP